MILYCCCCTAKLNLVHYDDGSETDYMPTEADMLLCGNCGTALRFVSVFGDTWQVKVLSRRELNELSRRDVEMYRQLVALQAEIIHKIKQQ